MLASTSDQQAADEDSDGAVSVGSDGSDGSDGSNGSGGSGGSGGSDGSDALGSDGSGSSGALSAIQEESGDGLDAADPFEGDFPEVGVGRSPMTGLRARDSGSVRSRGSGKSRVSGASGSRGSVGSGGSANKKGRRTGSSQPAGPELSEREKVLAEEKQRELDFERKITRRLCRRERVNCVLAGVADPSLRLDIPEAVANNLEDLSDFELCFYERIVKEHQNEQRMYQMLRVGHATTTAAIDKLPGMDGFLDHNMQRVDQYDPALQRMAHRWRSWGASHPLSDYAFAMMFNATHFYGERNGVQAGVAPVASTARTAPAAPVAPVASDASDQAPLEDETLLRKLQTNTSNDDAIVDAALQQDVVSSTVERTTGFGESGDTGPVKSAQPGRPAGPPVAELRGLGPVRMEPRNLDGQSVGTRISRRQRKPVEVALEL